MHGWDGMEFGWINGWMGWTGCEYSWINKLKQDKSGNKKQVQKLNSRKSSKLI